MTDQLTPDAAQIRLHLEILFSDLDALGPYPNGLFELRFLPPNGGPEQSPQKSVAGEKFNDFPPSAITATHDHRDKHCGGHDIDMKESIHTHSVL